MILAALLIAAVVVVLVFALVRLSGDEESVRRLQRSEYKALVKSIWFH